MEIDAESAVRELVDEVKVVIETQEPNGGGWLVSKSPRFEPKVERKWPLESTVDSRGMKLNYLVTATARDEREAVVAEVRALRNWQDLDGHSIFLRFEAACVRRMELCPKGETCHDGKCVDARYEAVRDAPEPPSRPSTEADAGPDPGGPTVATEGEGCAPDGARACLEEGSRTPLECVEGSWRPATMCNEDELCDTALGAQRGRCRQVITECRNQSANVPFCDREIMRVCTSSFNAETRPCGANEHCVAKTEAQCECMTGFVPGEVGCERPTDCKVANGGCDVLTTCEMRGMKRECGPCPAGYVGNGETGCEPLLAGLKTSAGDLAPVFDPTLHAYRVNVALLTQRLTFTATAPSAERLELNGTAVASGAPWTTPTLPLGEYPVKLTLTSKSGTASDYEVIVERTGAQTAYIKASNPSEGDNFGASIAMSGDTLVVGSIGESSAATKVDGDQADNSASGAGAAYVFVQRGNQWEQQAYLKASDAAANDHFGSRVAIEGDTIVIGKVVGSSDQTLTRSVDRPGAAYIFTRSAGKWSQLARLLSPDSAVGDRFGHGVAINGDTIAIGAPSDGGDGSTFLFSRDGKYQQKLKAMPGASGAAFGYNVALSNDTLLVAAALDSRPVDSGGSAYVYVRSAAGWQLQQRLVPDPPSANATFGYGLAVFGDRVLIGAPRVLSIINAVVTTEPGEVFAFQRTAGTWTQTQMLRGLLPRVNDGFGASIAMAENTALIGACNDASGARSLNGDASRADAGYAGAAYLFALENDRWKSRTYLKASNADALDSFGYATALSGDTAVVSANWEASKAAGINGNADDDSSRLSGAVYVFQ
ncbi:MAG TPA: cadherin-like beta sandwich domain-containing protein [Polyangiales bacterium]|nr:cadherin-like beta sandwich domain-containing protein [Polyangiales bacterium]